VLFDRTDLYAARLLQDADGGWALLGFINEVDGEFVGTLSDPVPVTADPVLGLVHRPGTAEQPPVLAAAQA
jgi:beta-fructofuranosidase